MYKIFFSYIRLPIFYLNYIVILRVELRNSTSQFENKAFLIELVVKFELITIVWKKWPFKLRLVILLRTTSYTYFISEVIRVTNESVINYCTVHPQWLICYNLNYNLVSALLRYIRRRIIFLFVLKLTKEEYEKVENYLYELDLENGYIQELGEHEEEYVPTWEY